MIILSIDTSCDDTCIAILKIEKKKIKVLSNIISSQIDIHQKYGGVYPSLAKREHEKNLVPVLKQAMNKAKVKEKFAKPDLIAVTTGPGLEPCLWVGLNFAKSLSFIWNIDLVPVNHIEGHILANFINGNANLKFPAICLVVSGGHTQIILMRKIKDYKIIGETRDDAAGECFDKTARILGLPYPGGPSIVRQIEKFPISVSKFQIKLPRPMIYSKDYDFSFSGLKTAVLYDHKKRNKKIRTSQKYISEMAKEIQQSIIDVLIKKTIKAAKDYKVKTIILGGGVTANQELKKQFKKKIEKEIPECFFSAPNSKSCTDNAAMVGVAGYFNKNKAIKNPQKIKVNSNLRI
jgi:N6-L-threonylcarbamoyladenine synthase